ncbi:hypothetical protein COY17_02110 [Candidatus Saccharibacteria bacterium CG_4_10_14_0_2_um_filter_52_9]|nr:MAG: hypothetical protein COY17_02110 [Candidatus Saccharibacteria bacterium CG_4_10_14_0_2_um_filter_52_9]
MATDQAPEPTQTKPGTSKRKSLKLAGMVAAGLFVLLLVIGLFANPVAKYSTSDLVSETKDNISYSRPKQWVDASKVEKLKKDFGLSSGNASVFSDKIVQDKNGNSQIPTAFVLFGKASDASTDVTVFKDPAVRSQFEKTMDTSLTQDSFKSNECRSVNGFSKNFNYDYIGFPVSVALKFNCQLSDTEKKNLKSDSIEVRMAIIVAKNGNTYLYALFASDKSWAKNEPVYLQMMKDLHGN